MQAQETVELGYLCGSITITFGFEGTFLISIYSIPFQIYEYTVTLVTSFHMHKVLV